MSAEDEYRTIRGEGFAEVRVKGSRFLASAGSAGSEDAAKRFIEQIRRRFHDASHNCYAYRVGRGHEALIRSSDAGEPSGTAGRPILETILGRGLTDVVVVVTRYFGGTKLGTGGLARAYRDCAQKALDAAGTARQVVTMEFGLRFPYDVTKDVLRVVRKHRAGIVRETYGREVRLTVAVWQSGAERFRKELELLDRLTVIGGGDDGEFSTAAERSQG